MKQGKLCNYFIRLIIFSLLYSFSFFFFFFFFFFFIWDTSNCKTVLYYLGLSCFMNLVLICVYGLTEEVIGCKMFFLNTFI